MSMLKGVGMMTADRKGCFHVAFSDSVEGKHGAYNFASVGDEGDYDKVVQANAQTLKGESVACDFQEIRQPDGSYRATVASVVPEDMADFATRKLHLDCDA